MADSYVCSGATMKCTMGDQSAKLTVLPSRTVFLCGKPMANISDHASMVNLAPFGKCRSLAYPATAAATAAALGTLTPMPCVHNTPINWVPGKLDYLIQGQPALLKSCKCTCMWGGVISITDDGQSGEGTQWIKKSRKESSPSHILDNSSKDGYLSDVFHKASIFRKQGLSIFESIKKATHVQNFVNSKNKNGYMSDDDADKTMSNKKYGTNEQYGINCATTTVTFMMRKRGYDVTARARNANEHTDSIAYDLNLYKVWKNPDGSDVTPTMLLEEFNNKVEENGLTERLNNLENVKSEISKINDQINRIIENSSNNFPGDTDLLNLQLLKDRKKALEMSYSKTREKSASIFKEVLMDACQEEGYYTFGISWEPEGGHYTVIKSQKDNNGNIILSNIEPQTGEPFEDIDSLLASLKYPPSSDDTIMRTDNKIFNEDYIDVFDIN